MVDALRSCYSRECKFYKNQTIRTRIVWYFTDPGAEVLSVPTVFHAYRQQKELVNIGGVGEQTNSPAVWRNGSKPIPSLIGDHFEGTELDYLGLSPAIESALSGEALDSERPHCVDGFGLLISGGLTAQPEDVFNGGGGLGGGGVFVPAFAGGGGLGGGDAHLCQGKVTGTIPAFVQRVLIAEVTGTAHGGILAGRYPLILQPESVPAWVSPNPIVGPDPHYLISLAYFAPDWIVTAQVEDGVDAQTVLPSGTHPVSWSAFDSPTFTPDGSLRIVVREATTCDIVYVGGGGMGGAEIILATGAGGGGLGGGGAVVAGGGGGLGGGGFTYSRTPRGGGGLGGGGFSYSEAPQGGGGLGGGAVVVVDHYGGGGLGGGGFTYSGLPQGGGGLGGGGLTFPHFGGGGLGGGGITYSGLPQGGGGLGGGGITYSGLPQGGGGLGGGGVGVLSFGGGGVGAGDLSIVGLGVSSACNPAYVRRNLFAIVEGVSGPSAIDGTYPLRFSVVGVGIWDKSVPSGPGGFTILFGCFELAGPTFTWAVDFTDYTASEFIALPDPTTDPKTWGPVTFTTVTTVYGLIRVTITE